MSAAMHPPTRHHESIVFSQPNDRENTVSRHFRAPRERVFHFFTDRATAPYLWAPDLRVSIGEMDFRPGGRFAFRVHQDDGASIWFSGEYREIEPPKRVVNTFEVSALPGVVAVETDEFETEGEFTRLSVRWQFDRTEDRDKMGSPELESALTAIWNRAADLLESGARFL